MIPAENYFFFKGERRYIHSVEIFNSFISTLKQSNIREIDFSISKKITTKWYFSREKPSDRDQISGQLLISGSLNYVIEGSSPIKRRKDYDESEVLKNSMIHNNRITHPNTSLTLSFMENVVASYKHLLKSLVAVADHHPQNYVFMRLSIKSIPTSPFAIIHQRKFAKKYLEGLIVVEDIPVGKIYFLEE